MVSYFSEWLPCRGHPTYSQNDPYVCVGGGGGGGQGSGWSSSISDWSSWVCLPDRRWSSAWPYVYPPVFTSDRHLLSCLYACLFIALYDVHLFFPSACQRLLFSALPACKSVSRLSDVDVNLPIACLRVCISELFLVPVARYCRGESKHRWTVPSSSDGSLLEMYWAARC